MMAGGFFSSGHFFCGCGLSIANSPRWSKCVKCGYNVPGLPTECGAGSPCVHEPIPNGHPPRVQVPVLVPAPAASPACYCDSRAAPATAPPAPDPSAAPSAAPSAHRGTRHQPQSYQASPTVAPWRPLSSPLPSTMHTIPLTQRPHDCDCPLSGPAGPPTPSTGARVGPIVGAGAGSLDVAGFITGRAALQGNGRTGRRGEPGGFAHAGDQGRVAACVHNGRCLISW